MNRPFSVFIGLRYTLTRKHNFFLSFVSLISMLGVSLGVMILIIALSVMNGSISTLRSEALKSVPHVTISGPSVANNWQQQAAVATSSETVLAAAPFLQGEANALYQGRNKFINLRGIDASLEAAVVNNPGRRYQELLSVLAATENGIILGAQLAGSLGIVSSGELSITALNSLLARRLSDSQGFKVVGFADFGFYGNSDVALINLAQAESLFSRDPGTNLQLRLRMVDIFSAESDAIDALQEFDNLDIQPWNKIQANLFNALNMEKILTSFMLLMIVVIGAVNIVSTLVMVVADKGADVAILRTMGASKGTIMKIFIVQGLVAGVFGTLVGAVLGVLLALKITDISLFIERLINSVTGSNIYLISHLQTQINWIEVLWVCLAALLISFLATLYPAYRASKIQPAEVLRYE
ncbi:MAG: lipoprotein-releasing system transmembrane subunit LolC [SAR86 cluster bacterium]|uniref:Lipoprotein-releasing system transmembrane subunit LolC n=1 Tax=SAR86 cluster bacterium TaxID=2030880 RepID=A0A2A5AUP4_9GAMM|nr:MAG: lipoprotein-releasing system transmembrane subunit LolC [SAR86 cluster bacterium]